MSSTSIPHLHGAVLNYARRLPYRPINPYFISNSFIVTFVPKEYRKPFYVTGPKLLDIFQSKLVRNCQKQEHASYRRWLSLAPSPLLSFKLFLPAPIYFHESKNCSTSIYSQPFLVSSSIIQSSQLSVFEYVVSVMIANFLILIVLQYYVIYVCVCLHGNNAVIQCVNL